MRPPICLALKTRTHSVALSEHGKAYRQAIGVKLTVALPRIKDHARLEDMVLVIGSLATVDYCVNPDVVIPSSIIPMLSTMRRRPSRILKTSLICILRELSP